MSAPEHSRIMVVTQSEMEKKERLLAFALDEELEVNFSPSDLVGRQA